MPQRRRTLVKLPLTIYKSRSRQGRRGSKDLLMGRSELIEGRQLHRVKVMDSNGH